MLDYKVGKDKVSSKPSFQWPWKRLKVIEEVKWMNWSAIMRRLWGTKDTKHKHVISVYSTDLGMYIFDFNFRHLEESHQSQWTSNNLILKNMEDTRNFDEQHLNHSISSLSQQVHLILFYFNIFSLAIPKLNHQTTIKTEAYFNKMFLYIFENQKSMLFEGFAVILENSNKRNKFFWLTFVKFGIRNCVNKLDFLTP